MNLDAAHAALRNMPRAAYTRTNEPIFDQLWSEYMDSADYYDFAPGGIGRVMQDMDYATCPAAYGIANVGGTR